VGNRQNDSQVLFLKVFQKKVHNMVTTEMTDKLWDLANITTGFAVVQSIATAFALARDDFSFLLRNKTDHIWAIIFTAVFNALYIASVFYFRSCAKISPEDVSVWTIITWGRALVIFFFALLPLMAFWSHLKRVQDDQNNHSTKLGGDPQDKEVTNL
jgi:hypothetical protein